MRLDSSAARARSQNLSPRRATPSQPPPLLHPYPHLHPRAAIRKRNSGEGKSLKLKRRDLPLRHLTPTPPKQPAHPPSATDLQGRTGHDTTPTQGATEIFPLAQPGHLISPHLQSEGRTHGRSDRPVVAHMGGR